MKFYKATLKVVTYSYNEEHASHAVRQMVRDANGVSSLSEGLEISLVEELRDEELRLLRNSLQIR